jgi:hypothetical protein
MPGRKARSTAKADKNASYCRAEGWDKKLRRLAEAALSQFLVK